MSDYVFAFVKNTQTFQINDARLLPIIIPTQEQLRAFKQIFNKAYTIQKEKFAGKINESEAEEQLAVVQQELDTMVEEMYIK